jgi:hypothetical protein
MEIQEIIRDYFDSLYPNEFENLEEMDRFLETYNHPKLKKEDTNLLSRYITQNVIEATRKPLPPKRKVQDLMDSLLNCISHLKKN